MYYIKIEKKNILICLKSATNVSWSGGLLCLKCRGLNSINDNYIILYTFIRIYFYKHNIMVYQKSEYAYR